MNEHLDEGFVFRIARHIGLPFGEVQTIVKPISCLEKAEIWRRITHGKGKGKSHMSGRVLEGDIRPGRCFGKRKMRKRW